MHSGAKQGTIFSPIQFTIYIDDLLIYIKRSCIGCHIDNQYMCDLAYADDITLSFPSINYLRSKNVFSQLPIFAINALTRTHIFAV